MERKFSRVLVGMSGGVDSSAAALLLRQQGYEVSGATLLLCPGSSEEDDAVRDAAAVCAVLEMEHRVIDLRDRFKETVIADFTSEYSRGRTPNPCVLCNRVIKFGAMLDYALENGFDAVATGHYAQISADASGRSRIMCDPSPKDQSYVLWQLSERQRAHILLPVNGRSKDELRALVRDAGLPVYAKPDSQDICFIPDGDYVGFLERFAGIIPQQGNFVDGGGKVLGRHKGAVCYTVGQRKGLGGGFPEPMYVNRIDMERNEIILGGEGSQYARQMICTNVNLHGGTDELDDEVTVKARYSARPAAAHVELLPDSTARVIFEQPQRALTPGQSAVFYKNDLLLGGGIIHEASK